MSTKYGVNSYSLVGSYRCDIWDICHTDMEGGAAVVAHGVSCQNQRIIKPSTLELDDNSIEQ